jgi:hypothetical protein
MSSREELITDLHKLCADQRSYPSVIQIATKATQGQPLDPATIQQISAVFDSVLPPKVQQLPQFNGQPQMGGLPPPQMGGQSMGAPQIGGFSMGAPAMGVPAMMATGAASGSKQAKFYSAQEFQQMVQAGQSTGQYYCHKQLGATSSRPGSYCCNAVKTFDSSKSVFEQVCSQHNRAKGGSKSKSVGFGSVEGAMAGFLNNFGAPTVGGIQQPPQFGQMGSVPGMGPPGAPQFNPAGGIPGMGPPGAPQMQQQQLQQQQPGGIQNPSIQQSSFNPMGAPMGIQQPPQFNTPGMGPPGAPQFNPASSIPGAPSMQQQSQAPPLGVSSVPQFNPMGVSQQQSQPGQVPQFNPMQSQQLQQQQPQQLQQPPAQVPQFNPMQPQQLQQQAQVPQFNPMQPQQLQQPPAQVPQFNPMQPQQLQQQPGQQQIQQQTQVPQFNPLGVPQQPGQQQVAQPAAAAFVLPSSTTTPLQQPNGMQHQTSNMNPLSQPPVGAIQQPQNVPGQTPMANGIPLPPPSIVPSAAMPPSLLQHQKKADDPSQLTSQFSQMNIASTSQSAVAPQFQQQAAPVAPQFQQPVPVTQQVQPGFFMRSFGNQEMFFNDEEGAKGIVFIRNGEQMYAINSIDVTVNRSTDPLPEQFTSFLKTTFSPMQESWLKSHGIQYNSVVPSLIENEEVRADDEIELQNPDGSAVGDNDITA